MEKKKANKKMRNLFNKWYKMYSTLRDLRTTELQLRKELTDKYLNGAGSVKVATDDFIANIRRSFTHSVDAAVLESIWDDLTEQEQNVIKWRPALDVRAYNALSPEMRVRLDEAIITKLAAPTIKPEL